MAGKHDQSGGSDTYLTPPYILKALGTFDLDPCTPPTMPWQTANNRYTEKENGLIQPWKGRVFMNPPYSHIDPWCNKMIKHSNGIGLYAVRCDTNWFFNGVWDNAYSALFLKGRIKYYTEEGYLTKYSAGAPSVLVAYSWYDVGVLANCGLPGKHIILKL